MTANIGLARRAHAVLGYAHQHSFRVEKIVIAQVSPLRHAPVMYASPALKIHIAVGFQGLHYVIQEPASNAKPMQTVLLLLQLDAQVILVSHAQEMVNVPI